ncbi:MAG: hypothetical protein ACYTBZ_27645 [Planctomycetota bacterium]|jgi:L-rhamnose isomerase
MEKNSFDQGVLVEKVDQHEQRLDKHDLAFETIIQQMDKFKTRLPNWAVFFFSAMTLFIGWLLKALLAK